MDDWEPPYLHGAMTLLKECHETVETLFTRFERAEDARTKRKIIAAALHELKIHATIEELVLHPALEPERRDVQNLIAELESMTGDESQHDARFAVLSENVRRHIREEEDALFPPPTPARLPTVLALGTLLLTAAGALAQSNQGGGEQLNPNTSANSIANGGSTGAAAPINKVIVPVTPASNETAPASNEKDTPLKRPLPVIKPPVRKKKLSDHVLVKKIHGEIVHDLTLPTGSQDIKVAAAAGKVTLTGTVLNEDDKYKIAAKAADLVGPENVVNLIAVNPAAPSR